MLSCQLHLLVVDISNFCTGFELTFQMCIEKYCVEKIYFL